MQKEMFKSYRPLSQMQCSEDKLCSRAIWEQASTTSITCSCQINNISRNSSDMNKKAYQYASRLLGELHDMPRAVQKYVTCQERFRIIWHAKNGSELYDMPRAVQNCMTCQSGSEHRKGKRNWTPLVQLTVVASRSC